MFFKGEYLNFFKPLTGKYREYIVQCVRVLYERQYSSRADYGHALDRGQIIGLLEEALTHSTHHILEEPNDDTERFKTHREHANWILNQLLDSGWLAKQVDPANFTSTFPFTRMGRIFALSFIESDNTQIRTRHRNTRNTLNALEAFKSRGEVYDLLDAFEYSERIITDFTDVIAELDERKRELVKEVEAQQLVQQATEHFFDFMEKRFKPDIQVRLSADSVEKHRDDISKAVASIRRKSKDFKANAEKELRRVALDLCDNHTSYLYFILDTIEQRMQNAAEVMLPALRKALHGFTKRADIIIRQLSYINAQHDNSLLNVCKTLSDCDETSYNMALDSMAEAVATVNVKLIDPALVKLHTRTPKRIVNTHIEKNQTLDKKAQQELAIQQLLEQAFNINNKQVVSYLQNALREGKRISTRELPINHAKDLLAMTHIVEVAAVNNARSDIQFSVEPTGQRVENTHYFKKFDEFAIELLDTPPHTSKSETP